MVVFQFYLQSGKERKVGWVMTVMLFLVKKFTSATASSFVTKAWGKILAHFHAVTVKCHGSIKKCLFGPPGRIICEQSP
jgi:hypothetical protein